MTRLRTLVALSSLERRLLLSMTVLIAAVRLGFLFLPLRILRRALAWGLRAFPLLLARHSSPDDIVRAVSRASSRIPGASCLVQALAVQALLERLGYPARLCVSIGKSEDDGGLQGHAWVESEGRVVIGRGSPAGYTSLGALERTRASVR